MFSLFPWGFVEARVEQGGRREGVCSFVEARVGWEEGGYLFIEARVGQGGRREHVSI